MKRHLSLATLVAVLGLATALPTALEAADSQEESPVLDRLVGTWRGQGSLQGNAIDAELTWEPVLGRRHVRMTYRAEVGGRTIFEGHAYYRPGEAIQGVWFDSAGHIYPIAAEGGADALVSDWGDPAIERGRSVYRLEADGGLTVVDSVFSADGSLREFARVTYRRVEP